MNLQYIRYALEISRTGSISKAAENLSVAQPNLSRAVKELETQLGISIFERTRTGMSVTPEGERLLATGERILREVADMETMFDEEKEPLRILSVIAPPSAYLSHAFMSFCTALPTRDRFAIAYREAASGAVIDGVVSGQYKLGILRIPAHFERYYTDKLNARELKWETVAEFSPVAVAGLGSSLAGCERVTHGDLSALCELVCPASLRGDSDDTAASPRVEITATERAVLYELLVNDPSFFLYDAPMPAFVAAKHGLLQRPVADATPYLDLLITQRSYRLTPTDEAYLRALRGTVHAVNGG